jgi:hypothetical protein
MALPSGQLLVATSATITGAQAVSSQVAAGEVVAY